MRRHMYGDSDQLLAGHTACRALQMLLLLLTAAAVPAAAAPFMSTDDPNTTTEATTLATDEQPLGALPEEERVAVMAYELAASLQRLAEQAAAGGSGDVTEEHQVAARIVTRQEDSREAPPRATPLHRALALHHHSDSTAKIISLSDRFHSILNRWVQATSNATYHKVMKVRAKITICFPFNVCFEIQDPWSLCCPF